MEKLNDFKVIIGDLMMNFQCIERDLKLIYGIIKTDTFNEATDLFLDLCENKVTLGTIINYLEQTNFFSNEDIINLNSLTFMRNYYTHQVYLEFIYDINDIKTFKKIYNKALIDKIKIEKLQQSIEKYRISIM